MTLRETHSTLSAAGRQSAARRVISSRDLRARRKRTRRLLFESLEPRTLLAITAQLNADGTGATFVGDGADDNLRLRANASNHLEYSTDGSSYSELGLVLAPNVSISVDLGGGNDQLSVDQPVATCAAPVTVSDPDVVSLGNITAPYGLTVNALDLRILFQATISTRQLALGSDPATADSTGNSGDLEFTAPSIDIASGARLLAQATSPFTAGKLALIAEDTVARGVGIFDYAEKLTPITVAGATIQAGDITISSTVAEPQANDVSWVQNCVVQGTSALKTVAGQVMDLVLPASMTVRGAEASITLTDTQVVSSGSVTINAVSRVDASVSAISTINSVNPISRYAAAVGLGTGAAHTELKGTTSITAAQNVEVTSDAETIAEVKALVYGNTMFLGTPVNQKDYGATVAIAKTKTDSQTLLEQGTTISAGGNVKVDASGRVVSDANAVAWIYVNGTAGLGFAVNYDETKIAAQVDGHITAGGQVLAKSFAKSAVNTTDNTVTLPEHGFREGDETIYSSGPGVAIGGLQNGQSYQVHVVDKDHIQLSLAPAIDLNNADANPASHQTLTPSKIVEFDPTTAVDLTTDTIEFPSDPGLQTGDKVYYTPGPDQDSEPLTGAIGPTPCLFGETEYYVIVVSLNPYKIQLALNRPSAVGYDSEGTPVPRTPIDLTGRGTGTQHSFVFDDVAAVKTFSPRNDVQSKADTIGIPNHGFQTGDVVHYQVDPTISGAREIVKNQTFVPTPAVDTQTNSIRLLDHGFQDGDQVAYSILADGVGAQQLAIGGLNVGSTYFVKVVDSDHFQLCTDSGLNSPVTLTDAGAGHRHRFSRVGSDRSYTPTQASDLDTQQYILALPAHGLADDQEVFYHTTSGLPISGLIDGRSYFIAVVDDDHVKLLSEPRGSVVPASAVAMGSTHTFTPCVTFDPAPVDVVNHNLHLPGHGFVTGDVITYQTNYLDGAGLPIGGLQNGTQYYVIRLDESNLQLADSASHAAGGTAIPLAGGATGILHNLKTTATVTEGDAPLGGLEDGRQYYVTVLDADTIRLATSEQEAFDAAPVILDSAVGSDTGHTFGKVGQVQGLTINAQLWEARDNVTTRGATGNFPRLGSLAADPAVFFGGGGGSPFWRILTQPSPKAALKSATEKMQGAGFKWDEPKFSVGLGLGWNTFMHTVHATVGGTAVLQSNGDLSVTAGIKQYTKSVVDAAAGMDSGKGSFTVALATGLFINDSQALLDDGAQVDARGTLTVASLVEYPWILPRFNLWNSDDSQVLAEPAADQGSATDFVRLIFDAYGGGRLGLDNMFNTVVTTKNKGKRDIQQDASGEQKVEFGLALSLGISSYQTVSRASIGQGARVNQTPAFWDNHQAVSVNATTHQVFSSAAGVIHLDLNHNGLKLTRLNRDARELFTFFGNSAQRGIGGSLIAQLLDNTTEARIEPGVRIRTGADGDGLQVNAREELVNINLVQSGGEAKEWGVTGAISAYTQSSQTSAHIDSGALISGGPVSVASTDLSTIVTGVGAIQKSQSVGVGASAGLNYVDRTTAAYIGNAHDSLPGTGGTEIQAQGDVRVTSAAEGRLWAFTLAGAITGTAQTDALPKAPEGTPKVGQAGTPARSGIGVSGAVSVNLLFDKTLADLNDTGTVTTTGGHDVLVESLNNQGIIAAAGAAAIAYGDPTRAGATSAGIAGSLAWNLLTSETAATLRGASVVASDVLVWAQRGGFVFSVCAGGAGAGLGTSGLGTAVAFDVSATTLDGTTQATVDNAAITATGDSSPDWTLFTADGSDSAGSYSCDGLRIEAGTAVTVISLGGAASLGGRIGVGAAVGVDVLTNTTRATLRHTAAQQIQSDGDLQVAAHDESQIWSLAASLGTAGRTAAGAGTLTINTIVNTIEAFLQDVGTVLIAGSLSVSAQDAVQIYSLAGAVGVTKGSTGFGAAVANNDSISNVAAWIAEAEQIAYGSDASRHGVVQATADSTSRIITVAFGVAGTDAGLSLAGSVAANLIVTNVDAHLTDSHVQGPGTLAVLANDRSEMGSFAGEMAFSKSGQALGATISYNRVSNALAAYLDGAEVRSTEGGVTLSATSSPLLVGLGTGGSGGQAVSGAGSININSIANSVDAHIRGSTVRASGDVLVTASESAAMYAAALAVAYASGNSAVGASLAYNYVGSTLDPFDPDVLTFDEGTVSGTEQALVRDQSTAPSGNVRAYIDASDVAAEGRVLVVGGFDDPGQSDTPGPLVETTLTIDSPDVTLTGNAIRCDTAQGLKTGDQVWYDAHGSAGLVGGLTDHTRYFVIKVDDHTLKLAATQEDAVAGKAVALTSAGSGDQRLVPLDAARSQTFDPVGSTAIQDQDGNVQSEIKFAGPHGLLTGDAVLYSHGEDSTDTSIGGLTDGNVYYVIKVDSNTVQLATSASNAAAGTFLTLGAGAVGGRHSLTPLSSTPVNFHAGTAVTVATAAEDQIRFAAAHGLNTGDAVIYRPDASGGIGGLRAGETYYVIKVDDTRIQLAATLQDADPPSEGSAPAALPHPICLTSATGSGHRLLVKTRQVTIFDDSIPLPQGSDSQLVSVTAAGAGGQTIVGAGAVSLNFVRLEVDAHISNTPANQPLTAGGSVSVLANDRSHIASGAGALTFAKSGGQAAFNASVGVNDIRNYIHATVAGADVASTGGAVTVGASEAARDLNVVAGAAVLSGSGAAALGGSLAFNFIHNTVAAQIESNVISGGSDISAQQTVSVLAQDTPTSASLAGQISLAWSGRGAAGVAFAVNDIQDAVTASIDGSTARSTHGDLVVEATFAPPASLPELLDAQIVAMAVSGGLAQNFSGAGSVALNWIHNTVQATVANIDNLVAGDEIAAPLGKISVTASDSSTIKALAGALAIAGIGAQGASGALGASVSYNYLGGNPSHSSDTTSNVVRAAIENVAGSLSAQQLEVHATYDGQIHNVTVAGAAAGTFALGGAVSINRIRNTTDAHVANTASVNLIGDGADIRAADTATIEVLAGGVGLALKLQSGAAISAGVSVALNEITGTRQAFVSNSTLTSADTVTVAATSSPTITALTIALAGALMTGGSGLAGSGAGAGSGNTLRTSTLAYVQSSTVSVTGGDLTLAATDSSKILAGAGGIGLAGNFGGSGVSLSAGISYTENDVQDTVQAYAADSTLDVSGQLGLDAKGTAQIQALTVGGALAAAVGSSAGVALAVGATIARNTIDNDVAAYLQSVHQPLGNRLGSVAVAARQDATIETFCVGASLAVGGSGSAGVALSGGDAEATNVILGATEAYVQDSALVSAGDVAISAENKSQIEAHVVAVAVSVGIGGAAGVAAALGGSSADNFLGYTADGQSQRAGVRAYLRDASVDATGALTLAATASQTVAAVVWAGAAAVAGGGTAGVAVSYSGVQAENKIGVEVQAFIDGQVAIGGGVAEGLRSRSLTLTATDTSTIEATANAASIAGSAGEFGGSIAIGVTRADNAIGNAVEAYIRSATVATTGGDLNVQATEHAAITADSQAAAVAVSLSIGGSFSGGGAETDATVQNTTRAYIDQGTLTVAGNLSVSASEASTATAEVQATSASLGLIAAAIAGSQANATVSPTTQVYASASNITAKDVNLTASSQPQAYTNARGFSVSTGASVGASYASSTVSPGVTAYVGGSGRTITADNLTVTATAQLPATGDSARADANGSSGGLLLGVDATVTKVANTANVQSYVAGGTTLNVTGATQIAANNRTKQTADADSRAGGLVAAGVAVSDATATTTTEAYLGSGVKLIGRDLTITALGYDNNYSETTAGAGGAFAGVGARATTFNLATTRAEIQDGNSSITLSGAFVLGADHTAEANHRLLAGTGGAFAGAGAKAEHTINSTALASLGAGGTVAANDIQIDAINRLRKPEVSDGKNIDGGAGSLLASGATVESTTVVAFSTQVTVGNNAVVELRGSSVDPGQFSLRAFNDFQAVDKVNFLTFGAIGSGIGAFSTIRADTDLAQISIGQNATLTSVGEINLSARGTGNLSTKVNADAGGLASVVSVATTAELHPRNEILVQSGASLSAWGDLKISAGTDTNFGRDVYSVDASSDSFAAAVIPIDDLDAQAILVQDNFITVSRGAVLQADGDAKLHAEEVGSANLTAFAKGVNWAGALAEAINGGMELDGGKVTTETHALVTIDGTVRTGENRHKALVLIGWDQVTGQVTWVGSPGIALTSSPQPVNSDLLNALANAQTQKALYPQNAALQAFYDGEITRIQTELRADGLMREVSPGSGIFQAVQQSAITAIVEPITAQAGKIDIRADQLSGSGEFSAPGDASVTITNHTPAFLRLQGIQIPEINGGVYLNGSLVSNYATLAEIRSAIAAENALQIAASGQATEQAWFTAQGGAVGFHSVNASSGTADPIITVTNALDVTTVTDGKTYPWPDITVLSARDGGVGVSNLRGSVTFDAKPVPAARGEVVFEGPVAAQNVNVVAGGSIFIQGLTTYNVGGDPYSQWLPFTGGDGTLAANTNRSGLPYDQTPTTPSLAADRIVIDAEYINVDGIIQSGKPDFNLTLGTAVADEISRIRNAGATGVVRLSVVTTEDFTVSYDVAHNQIILAELRTRGGYIELSGHILNTGNGEIRALGGYSHINVTNATAYDLVLNRLDVSERGAGTILLKDKAQGTSADPYVTIYRQDANGVTRQENAGSPQAISAVSQYLPADGWRYAWSVGLETFNRQYGISAVSEWLGIDFLSIDPSSIQWQTSEIAAQPTLVPNSNYFLWDTSNTTRYDHREANITLSDSGPRVISQWTESTYYGTDTYYTKVVRETRTGTTDTHSVEADRPIAIKFLGYDAGRVSVVSNSGGKIILAGAIDNPGGTTTLTTNQSLESANDGASAGGLRVELMAGTGIGTSGPLRTEVADAGSLSATTAAGVVQIQETIGTLDIDQITSGDGSAVTVRAAGGLQAATGYTGLITGKSLILTASGGDVGADGTPLLLDSGTELIDTVTIHATGSVFVQEQTGDLRANVIQAGGNVWINVPSGGLVDANTNEVRDERTYDELKNGVWKDLSLTGADAQAKIETTLVAVRNTKTAEYNTYWQYRNRQADPTVYDPAFQVTLTAEEQTYYNDYYRAAGTEQGLNGTALDQFVADAITTLNNSRTLQYHTLHDQFGALGDSFDPGFTYTLRAAEEVALRGSIKVWTEAELLNTFSAGLMKTVSDTQANIEEANIVAANIAVTVSAGVGVTGGRTIVDLTNKPVTLTTDQRAKLAAAERVDVVYLSALPVSVTVDFFDNGPQPDTIVRRSGSWLADGFSIGQYLGILGATTNQTDNGTFYQIAAVTASTITLSALNSLSTEYARAVEVAPVILDPAISSDFQALEILDRQDVDVTASGQINVTAALNVFLGSETNVRIGQVQAGNITVGDKIRIKAGEGIINAAAGLTNIRGSDLILEAAQAAIGSAAAPLRIDVLGETTLTARAGTDIYLTETAGDLRVGTLFARTGDVELTAEAGSIVDGLRDDATKIMARSIVLTASGGIGESGATPDFLEVDVTSGTLTATAQDSLYVADTSGDLNLRNVLSRSGDVNLQAAVNLLDAVDLVDPTDPNSGDDLAGPASRPKANILGNNITLTSIAGQIGVSGNELDINSAFSGTGVVTVSSQGNIYLIETLGDLLLNQIGTGTNPAATAFLTAPGGSILNGNPVAGAFNILSGKTYLIAAQDIGQSSEWIAASVGHVEGLATAGSTYISNTGALEIGGVTSNPKGFLAGGEVHIIASSPLTVQKPVETSDGGDITLVASGTAVADVLTVNADITAAGGNGNITLYAGASISLTGTVTISAAGTGAVLLMAGTYDHNGTPANGTGAGDLSMADGTTIQSADGNITLRAPGNVSLSRVNANSNADATQGDVIVTADYDGVGGGLSDNSGSVTDNLAGGTANITGDHLALRAGSGIGDGAGKELHTQVTNLSFSNTASGDVRIFNAGGLIINSYDGLTTSCNLGSGVTMLRATSPVTFAVDTSSGGTLTAQAVETVPPARDTDNITVNALVTVQSTAGDVVFEAGDRVILAGATAVVQAPAGQIRLDSGVSDNDGDGGMTLDGTVAALTRVTLSLNAQQGATQAVGGRLAAHELLLLSTGSLGAFSLGLSSQNAVESLAADAGGAVAFQCLTGLEITTIGSTSGIATTGDDVTIVSPSGTITVSQAVITDPGLGGGIVLSGSVSVNAALTAGGGTITLNGNPSGDSDLIVSFPISSAGTLNLSAPRHVILHANGDVTAQGAVTVTADADHNQSGAITMDDGALLDATGGTLALSAYGDILLGGLLTTSAAAPAVTITSSAGGVIDNGDTHTNIDANRGTVVIDAYLGVGSGNALETRIGTLDAVNRGLNGNIELVELATGGDLKLRRLAQTNASGSGGARVSTEDGTITVVANQSGVSILGSGDLTLWADGGDGSHLIINDSVAATSGTVILEADEDVLAEDAGGTVTTTSGPIFITADVDGSSHSGHVSDGTIRFILGADISSTTGNITFTLPDYDGAINSNILNTTGTVRKLGGGILNVNGLGNDYTGPTQIDAGFFLVNGIINTDAGNPSGTVWSVNVNAGALLGGIGTIGATSGGRDVVVNATGTVEPGLIATTGYRLPGRLTINGDIWLRTNAVYSVQLDGITPATQYDQLRLNGTVNLTGSLDNPRDSILTERLTFAPPLGTSWRIIDNDFADIIYTRFKQKVEGAFYLLGSTLVNISYNAGDQKNDVVIGHEGRFQFDGFPTNTQQQFQSLGMDPFTGCGPLKTASTEVGWATPVRQDRVGDNEGISVPRDPYTPVSLLQGYAYTHTSGTLLLDALAKDTNTGAPLKYQVLLTSGIYGIDQTLGQFTVGDALAPDQFTTSVSTPRSVFAQRILQGVTVQELSAGSNVGQLQVEMTNASSQWFDRAALNAVDIRPMTAVGLIRITRQDGLKLTADLPVPQEGVPVSADGLTIDNYDVATPDPFSLFTVTISNGTLVTTDEDRFLEGVQVYSDAEGHFQFQVQRPAGTGGSLGQGMAMITAWEVGGRSYGTAGQEYTQRYDLSAAQTPLSVRRFDFNTPWSPTAAGYIGVLPDTVYSTTTGFGWLTPVSADDRVSVGDAMYRDLHYGTDGTFRVEVVPGASYFLRTYIGEPPYDAQTQLPVVPESGGEGSQLTHQNIRVTVGGQTHLIPSLPAHYFDVWVTPSAIGSPAGQAYLDITFLNDFIVNGLEIWSANTLQAAGTTPDALQGTEVTVDSLGPIVGEALARWEAIGLTAEQVQRLQQVTVQVADLTAPLLAETDLQGAPTIRMDRRAAGFGWFMDPSPGEDSEYLVGQPPAGMDLLTVLTHEFGHVLGLSDLDAQKYPGAVMSLELLPEQSRRLPTGNYVTVHNPVYGVDVNGDGSLSPLDLLVVINRLNTGGSVEASVPLGSQPIFADVNGDHKLTPLDVLQVLNELNRSLTARAGETGAAAEGEGSAEWVPSPPALATIAFPSAAPVSVASQTSGSGVSPSIAPVSVGGSGSVDDQLLAALTRRPATAAGDWPEDSFFHELGQ